jgi:small subunit ribosomal protein S4e
MGKKGGSKHLKRMPAPGFWPIHRKEFQWVVKPKPGPHPIERCLPLLLVVRDMLSFAETRREARVILAEGQVRVDGVTRYEEKFPVGLMDVVEIQTTGKAYRIIPMPRKGLALHPIDGEEKNFKLCKIENKTTVRGGNIQLNLHDGRNILIQVKDPKRPEEDVYKTSDVLKVSIPNQQILGHLPFGEGVLALVTGGKNIGRLGKVMKIERQPGPYPTVVTLQDKNGDQFQTTLDFVFAVGDQQPWITLPEEE